MGEQLGPATVTRSRSTTRSIAATVAVLVLVGLVAVAGSLASTIVCDYATKCSGTGRDDVIRGEGQNNLFGRGGDDFISSAGNSIASGGAGRDVIRAFRAGNLVGGGPGKDKINVANGGVDNVDCAGGRDQVTYDAVQTDTVENCERRFPR